MRHLIRTYTVWELIYQIWDRQTVLIKTKKKRKKTGAFKQCILLSLSVKPKFDLLDTPTAPGVLQSQCIHTCHTNGFIIRLLLLMIHTKDSEVLIFWQCLDNDVINLFVVGCRYLSLQYTCQMTIWSLLTTIISHLKGAPTLSVSYFRQAIFLVFQSPASRSL